MNIKNSVNSSTKDAAHAFEELGGDIGLPLNDRRFQLQRLSLDAAVAPCLSRPAAPFDTTERKRAHTAALYYSECFHRGIHPLDADNAAQDAQEQYDKWWIERTAKCRKRGNASSGTNQVKRLHTSVEEVLTESSMLARINGDDASRHVEVQLEQISSPKDVTINEHGRLRIPLLSVLQSNQRGEIAAAKAKLIQDLKASAGDVETPTFLNNMGILERYYTSRSWDGRGSCEHTPFSLEGNWLTISKPTYDECRGRNKKGDLVYTLGRMSFGMFRPTQLECSVQASFNTVRTIDPKYPGRPLHVPKKLMKELNSGEILLRSYDIVVAITIEPGQNRRGVKAKGGAEGHEYVVPRPINGILTNQAYVIPDPFIPNRLSIWFSGGDLEVQDEPADLQEWLKVFDSASAPDRNLREYANVLAARVILGALIPEEIKDDGKMSFELRRPIGGHGQAHCDILYMDEDLRIMRGHLGSVYVCTRVPGSEHIGASDSTSMRRSTT